jgi:adenylate cyclase
MEDGPTPNRQASAKPGMLGDGGGLSLNVKPSGVNSGHLFGKCEVGRATWAAALEAEEDMPQMNDEAYAYYRKGVQIRDDPAKFNPSGIVELREAFENAIGKDETASQAYAELAYTYARFYQQGWTTNPGAVLQKAEELATTARDLKKDFDSCWNFAIVSWNQGKFEKSFKEYEAAAEHWENNEFDQGFAEYVALRERGEKNPDLIADMAEAMIYFGEPDVAIQLLNEAIQIRHNMGDPFSKIPYWYLWNKARACYMQGRYQAAIDAIGPMTQPNDVLLIVAASKAKLGEVAVAMTYIAQFSQNDPEWSIARAAERYFRYDSDRQRWLDGLRKAGLKEQ